MRKAVKIGFIGVFCAVIGLAFPVFNIFSKQLSMDSHENRLMTGLPQVLQSPLRELPRNLDNFLVDNSPFRYQFVLVNAGLDYALFGTSQSDQVLPGKDGWLFYKDGPNAAQPMANYQGLAELNDSADTLAEASGRKRLHAGAGSDAQQGPHLPRVHARRLPHCERAKPHRPAGGLSAEPHDSAGGLAV